MSQEDFSVEEIISYICLTHNSTPHVATGETPFYLLTGTEFVLPNLQEITYMFNRNIFANRLKVLVKVREDVFYQQIDKLYKNSKAISPSTTSFKVNDIVLVVIIIMK